MTTTLNAIIDYRTDPAAWARTLDISIEAVELYLDSEVIDLHNDLYVPARLYGYNPHRRHRPGLLDARFTGQTDLPRLREARLGAAVFDIATNPARRGKQRASVALRNIERIKADLARHPNDFAFVTTASEYDAARMRGLTCGFIGIQGGQAFQHDRDALEAIPQDVHRITLVHLTNSRIGCTSSPLGPDRGGLTTRGNELVEVMNHKRILVDLAHINPAGFWDAVAAHDHSQPLICTHTGVDGVHEHWRNLDDRQIKAVADSGGTIGIIFHGMFLDGRNWTRCEPDRVLDHMEHVARVAGDDAVSIGTDYDGMVIPPRRLREVTDLPVLVQLMLDRSWSEARIRGALGLNALRVIREIRP